MNNTGKIRSFTDLNAWKEAHKLVILIYLITKKFPREELYSLTDQIRRAVISITSNIAHQLLQGLITSSKRFISIHKS